MAGAAGTAASVSYHIIGDAFVDLYCCLEAAATTTATASQQHDPKHSGSIVLQLGSDSKLSRPVTTMVGGSATNTATHLQSIDSSMHLQRHTARHNNKNNKHHNHQKVHLYTSINPHDEYGQLHVQHASKYGYILHNHHHHHHEDGPDASAASAVTATGHCLVIISQGDRTFMTHNGCMDHFHASQIHVHYYPDGDSHDDDDDDGDADKNSNAIDNHFETASSLSLKEQPQQQLHQGKQIAYVHVHIAGYYNIPGFWNGALALKLQSIRNNNSNSNSNYNRNATKHDAEDDGAASVVVMSLVPQYDASGEWDGGLMTDILPLLDFILMNQLEANHISGYNNHYDYNDDDDDDLTLAIRHWCAFFNNNNNNQNGCWVIITLGAKGAIAIRNGSLQVQQKAVAIPWSNIVDPTGAGDSFCAGFLHGLYNDDDNRGTAAATDDDDSIREWPPRQDIQRALQWGCGMGACCIMTHGASVPAPTTTILDCVRDTKTL